MTRLGSVWSPIWFMVIFLTPFGIYAALHPAHNITVEKDVAVIKIINPYRYTFQPVDAKGNLQGQEFTVDICRDYESPSGDFLNGIILKQLIHTDEGGCWSLNPDKHCGYYKRRDAAKNPLYARLTP